MLELIRTNDVVLLSFAGSLLDDAGLRHFIADAHMSVFEGSIGVIQRRLLVAVEDGAEAIALLRDAGLDGELREDVDAALAQARRAGEW